MRIAEHRGDARNDKLTAALAQHTTTIEHTADFENARILDIERRERTRLILQSLRIQEKVEYTVNHKEDLEQTNSIYAEAITANI